MPSLADRTAVARKRTDGHFAGRLRSNLGQVSKTFSWKLIMGSSFVDLTRAACGEIERQANERAATTNTLPASLSSLLSSKTLLFVVALCALVPRSIPQMALGGGNQLPPGGRTYYVNHVTKQTQWEVSGVTRYLGSSLQYVRACLERFRQKRVSWSTRGYTCDGAAGRNRPSSVHRLYLLLPPSCCTFWPCSWF